MKRMNLIPCINPDNPFGRLNLIVGADNPHLNPDGTTDRTTGHPTKRDKTCAKVVGHSHSTKPASGQVAGYPPLAREETIALFPSGGKLDRGLARDSHAGHATRVLCANGQFNIKGLYAITPDCADTADLLRRARLALAGGASVLQYRNKSADAVLRLAQVTALRELTREFAVPFIVNDDVLLAKQVDADGVHLGAMDGSLDAARAVLDKRKIIGVSCYNRLSLAQEAVGAGADYVAFGAFFPSGVKPGAVVADVELLRQARAELAVPLIAIGGINAQNGAALVQAGADALAVISALFDAADITATAQEFSKLYSN